MLSCARGGETLLHAEMPWECTGSVPHATEQRCSDLHPPALLPFFGIPPSEGLSLLPTGFASLPPQPPPPPRRGCASPGSSEG